jgi:hypothetical protein
VGTWMLCMWCVCVYREGRGVMANLRYIRCLWLRADLNLVVCMFMNRSLIFVIVC